MMEMLTHHKTLWAQIYEKKSYMTPVVSLTPTIKKAAAFPLSAHDLTDDTKWSPKTSIILVIA